MAKSCTISPKVKSKSGQIVDSILWKELRSIVPYSKAREAYLTVYGSDFGEKYMSKVAKDENDEPTLASIINLPEFRHVLDEKSRANTAMRKMGGEMDAMATRQNIDALDDKAIKYNESKDKDPSMLAYTEMYSGEMGEERVAIRVKRDEGSVADRAREMVNKRRLNRKLRDWLKKKGIDVQVLSELQQRIRRAAGVTDFQSSIVSGAGIAQTIFIARGRKGMDALPEEFSHFAIEALHDSPLVKRLYTLVLDNNLAESILGDTYEAYRDAYTQQLADNEHVGFKKVFADSANRGETKQEHTELDKMLAYEAIGHLVYQRILATEGVVSQAEVTADVSRLIGRIKEQFESKVSKYDVETVLDAVSEAQTVAQQFADNLMHGDLYEKIRLDNIATTAQFLQLESKIKSKQELLDRLIANVKKRYNLYFDKKGFDYEGEKQLIDQLESRYVTLAYEEGIMDWAMASLEKMRELNGMIESMKGVVDMDINERTALLRNIKGYLGSFNVAMRSVKDALYVGAIERSPELDSILAEVASMTAQLQTLYDQYSKSLFVEIIRQFVGDGIIIPSGRTAGHKYTAEELAEYADHDISFFDRWLDSMQESGDMVLKILDQIAKQAKHKARLETIEIKKRLLGAWNKLRDAGYSDTEFMYETVDTDGNIIHRFINEEKASHLSKAQQDYYNTIIDIKRHLDRMLPNGTTETLNAPVIRKSYAERMKDNLKAGDISGAWEKTLDSVKESFLRKADDSEFGGKVYEDFEGNPIDKLPIYFIKGSDLADVSHDTSSTMLMYAKMATDFFAMNDCIDTLELMRDNMEQRSILEGVNDVKGRKIYDKEDLTSKKHSMVNTNTYDRMNDWFASQVYGRYMKDEGYFEVFGEKVDKAKLANTVNQLTALQTFALNILAGISNVLTGSVMMRIESIAGQWFKWKDVARADGIFWGQMGKFMSEIGVSNKTSKLALFDEMFNVLQDYESDVASKDIQRNRFGHLIQGNSLYFVNNAGELWMQNRTALALAKAYVMLDPNGNKTDLWEALEVVMDENGVGRLRIKEGYTKEDGSEFTEDDKFKFELKSKAINQRMHGIYNYEDRNAWQSLAIGRIALMFRKWIKTSLNRRYGRARQNFDLGEIEEGYYITAGRFIKQLVNDMRAGQFNIVARWNDFTKDEYAKRNLYRAIAEVGHLVVISVAFALLKGLKGGGDDDDEKVEEGEFGGFKGGKFGGAGAGATWGIEDDAKVEREGLYDWSDEDYKAFAESYAFNMMLYQTRRLQAEIGAMTPSARQLKEGLNILKSPAAAVNTLQSTLNLTKLVYPSTWTTEVTTGRYKGRSEAYKLFMESPFIPIQRTILRGLNPKEQIAYYN